MRYDPLMILHRLHVSDVQAVTLVAVSPMRHSHRVPWKSISTLPTLLLQTRRQLVHAKPTKGIGTSSR